MLTCACGRLTVGGSLEVELPPLQQRPIVTLLSDEECVNFKAANLLLHPLAVRGFIVPEMSHRCWGDVSRALASAQLKGAVLKATLVINHFRGPYRSGKFAYDLQQAAAMFCEQATMDDFEKLTEDWIFDTKQRGQTLTEEKFMGSPGIRTKLPADSRTDYHWDRSN